MQCKEWDDANSELFKESHDAAVQKNSYKGRLCELISASLKSGGNAKSQENPASTLLLSSGNAGSCCKGWYPCFCDGLSYFLRICRIRFASPAPGSGRGKSGACIQGFLIPFCQSCIPAGMIAIYMTEGNRILPWSFRISFSIHLYCISTPFSQPSLKILLWYADSTIRILSFLGKHWGTLK